MRGGSIEALIEDRDTTRDQLDLRMRDRAVFVGEVPHPFAGQILGLDQLEPGERLLGHERQRTANIGGHAAPVVGEQALLPGFELALGSFGWIIGTQASPRWCAVFGRRRCAAPASASGSGCAATPIARQNVSIETTVATTPTISTYSASDVPDARTVSNHLRVSRPGSPTMAWICSTTGSGSRPRLAWRPETDAGESASLRRRHSVQCAACRVSAATARRVAPSSHAPGRARRCHALRCASTMSRRTGIVAA